MGNSANNLTCRRRVRNILLIFLVTIIFFAVLFTCAGSLRWFWGWILAGIMIAASVIGILILDPALLEERSSAKSGYKRWDILPAWIIGRLGPLAIVITSGLDCRFGWSVPFPLMLTVLGLVLCISAYVLTLWAMRVNKLFSSVVRIQKDRDHSVITSDPYNIVRHPGQLPEAVAVMLFYKTSEFVQDLSVSRSRRSVRALLDVRPDYANMKMEQGLEEVSPELAVYR